MRNIFTRLLVVLFILSLASVLNAQISSGKIYNIVNVGNSGYSLAAVSTTTNSIVTTDETDYSQLWYVGEGTADGSFTVRNLSNGFYLQTSWRFAKTPADLYCVTAGSDYTLSATPNSSGYDNMHYGANQGYVVGWTTDASATQWQFNEVSIEDAVLQTNWNEIEALEDSVSNCDTYEGLLDNIFSDKACTTFNSGYSYSTTETNYSGLPFGLKRMVAKIKNDNWAEDNADNTKAAWDHSYAKRFRLQMYEPYSIAGDITSWFRMNTHANNDNPTGIYVNGRGLVYVMVEGEIADGATLRLIDAGHNNRIGDATTGGYELESGLNVIPYYGKGGHLYICYNVDTYNADGTDAATRFPENRRLSKYAPLKIHIEGGAINGFYNAQGDFRASAQGAADDLWYQNTGYSVDCDADWEYMEERANLNVLPILAHRQILLFQLNDWGGDPGMKTLLPDKVSVPDAAYSRTGLWSDYNMRLDPNSCKINIMMEAWDRIMYSQHATLGLVSQSAMDKMNEMYPQWKSDGSTGDIYTYDKKGADRLTYTEFCGVDYSEHFNHHGVGLGTTSGYMSASGQHCNYHINTFGSIVGLIAKDAGPTWGPAHEIGHQHQAIFNLNGLTEVTNNFFSNVAVWYMGMGTSRVNGTEGSLASVLDAFNTEDNDLYTNNIWAITHLYYRLWLYYHLAGNNTQFWPRLFELLRQTPMVNGGQISGETSLLRFYQHACTAAGEDLTEFFRAHGFFELMTDRLVGDYSNATYNVTEEQIETAIKAVKANNYPKNYAILLINDGTSETTLMHDGKNNRALWDGSASAEYGSVTDFIEGNTSVTEAYDAIVSADGTVTMSGGEGGVGFLVFNEEGELVSFSNKSSFQLSDEAVYLLVTGQATIKAIDAENNTTDAAVVDLTALQSESLETLVGTVKSLLAFVDDTYTKVGYYKPSAVKDLQAAFATAKSTLETGSGIAAAYELLYTEYQKVIENEDARIAIVPGSKYAIKNKSGNDYMDVADDGSNVKTTGSATFPTDDSDLWIIESVSTDTYKIKNAASGKYLQQVSDANSVNFTVGDGAVNYKITNVETVLYAFSTTEFPNRYMDRHSASQVATWGAIGDNAKWSITLVDDAVAAKAASVAALQALVTKTESLVNSLATVTSTNIPGNEIALQADSESANYYILSSSSDSYEGGGVAALLDNDNDTYLHTNWHNVSETNDYLQVNIGSGDNLNLFRIVGVQRNGSAAQSDFPQKIEVQGSNNNTSWETITTLTGIPQSRGTSWERDVMSLRDYDYLRFVVTTGTNRIYFHLAEFSIFTLSSSTSAALLAEYAEYSSILQTSLIAEAYEGVEIGNAWLNFTAATADEIDDYTEVLQEKYDALYDAYKLVIDAEKAELQALITSTKELVAQVGTATVSADGKVDLLGKLYAERAYSGSNTGDVTTAENGYNLLDGNVSTYYHSDYEAATMVSPPYIRVDMGEGRSVTNFRFNYTTRNQSGCAPTTIQVVGGNYTNGVETYDEANLIATFTSSDTSNPLPTDASTAWTSDEIASETAYRYIKFKVTASQGNNSGGIYFAISELGFNTVGVEEAEVFENYKELVSETLLLDTRRTVNDSETMCEYAAGYSVTVAQLKQQQAAQQAAYDKLYAAKNNTAALKESLLELINSTQTLYNEMAADDGTVNNYYSTSTLTDDNLSEAFAQITAATEVYNNSSATVDDINTAYNELNAKYTVLKDIKDLDYTEERTIVTDIETAEDLLAEVMTAAEAPETVVLQNGDATQPYYIWCNKPANDSHGIAGGLIDKNDDGTANTSTFFGTYWNDGAVEPYAHYLEIDLGCVKSIENFAFDYTTRASGYENQRPNGIKVLVSNDKDVYNQVLAVTDGLAAGANEKWELDAPFGFIGRYVRFAVSSQKGYFNMSDFNISFDAAYSLQEYYTTSGIDANLLKTLNDAVQQAVKARDCFVTEEMYNTAIANLADAYNRLNTFKSAHISDRTELDNLAGTAETLVTEVATIDDTETAITMQCTDETAPYYLYCNADGTTHTTYPNDAKGVTALLDDDATNHLHTTYEGAADDNLDHYLRLDMGENEAMMSFKFSYTGRNDSNNNDPTVMLIEGSNDLENFEFITKLTDLPTSSTPTTYSSGVLGNGKAYRYIRFMVIETKNNTKYKDHPYFVLSQFAVTACKTIEVKSEYQSINLPLSKLVTANNEVVDAKAVVAENEHYLTETAYNEALDELKAAYNALNVAKDAQNIPVILTTDVNNPVLYKIKVKSNSNVFKYDGEADSGTKNPVLAANEVGDKYQAWYFMQGDNENSYDDIVIMPYYHQGARNTEYKLGYPNINGATKPLASVSGASSYNWYITFTSTGSNVTTEGWWNLQPENGTSDNTFLNQQGGSESTILSFWKSAANPDDNGSQFQFVLDETDYSKSDAYFELYNLHADCGGEKVSGEAIGCYTAATVETYNNAYNAATEKLADADATDDDYNSARTALEAAYNALTRNMPVVGGFYKIRSANKTADDGDTYSYDGVVYADDNNNVYWAKDYDKTSARAIWYIKPIEGGYNITNMHTGCSFTTLGWGAAATLSTTPATFTIDVLDDATGILKIVSGQPMHAQATGNVIVGYPGGLNSASAWTIEEVTVDDVVANIEHTITLAANTTGNDQTTGYSTLNLGYPVTVPAGVKAYIVTNSAIVDNTIELYEYASEGATIPANFPVILRGSIEESAGRAFKFNNAAVAAVDNVDNLLGGSNYTTYESCLDENGDNVYNIYMLTRKSGIVAMRWVYENYRADKSNTGSNDDGGYVKCPANKVYLKLGGATAQNLSTEYFFGIFSGTTDIDEVNTEENPLEGTIYDLQGRKIEEVVVPGFYIVNGKKMFINSELLK